MARWYKVSKQRRKNGTWVLRWRNRPGIEPRHASQHLPPELVTNAAEAERARVAKEMEINSDLIPKEPITWAKFHQDHFLPHWERLERRNRYEYDRTLTLLAPYVKELRLKDITSEHVEALLGKLKEDGLAPATIAKHRRNLRSVFNKAIEWRFMDYNPAKHAALPERVPRREPKVMEEKEFKRLLKHAPTEEWRRFLRLAWLLGLRANDMRLLEWGQIDLRRRILRHWDRKTKREQKRPLPPDAVKVLRKWRVKERTGPLFPTLAACHRDTFFHRVRTICREAKVDKRLHAIRSSVATRLALQGFHPSVISAWTLQSVETVMRYYTRVDDTRKVAESLRLPKGVVHEDRDGH